ncbi:hypothetical protein INS49_002816 [Diaporthe citri]|uniref:uncharacterized protein n=1 Tax=Diaporthe citri TaxID=83186 RepID=UPI001C8099D1|nr:uncharacterized protein INS49_002816 [Diaporthe citri]KAG6368603.1 hypothetical protein INS49_002816 [Diaporthe citri]
MGQAHSHFERPIGFWRRVKSKAARSEPSQESFVQISPPPPKADSSAQMDQSSAHADQSSTTADTTPTSAAPDPDMHGDDTAEANDKVGEADKVDKVEERTNSPHDQPMADASDKPDQPNEAEQSTQAAEEPTFDRPALKREYTPPHRIRISTHEAWKLEHAYSNVHDHVTKALNRIRQQQLEFERKSASARRLDLDIYKAADSCTLSLEYLVGNFSTKFFHHTGPENIMGMMATIEADAAALDELRLKQLQLYSYGYNLEKKIAQTEKDIRELAELAKRIKEGDVQGAVDGEADADGDTDPEIEVPKLDFDLKKD